MLQTDKIYFFKGIIQLVRFIIAQENVRYLVNGLKYDRLATIVYFRHIRFSALLGKLSKLQQIFIRMF